MGVCDVFSVTEKEACQQRLILSLDVIPAPALPEFPA
jgi:hypothetical protein